MRESKVPRYIILIILGIMAIGLGIKGISEIVKYNSEWERFKLTAVSTQATISDISSYSGRGGGYTNVHIKFTDDSDNEYNSTIDRSCEGFEIGKTITVYYNKDDPKKTMLEPDIYLKNTKKANVFMFVIGGAFIAAGIVDSRFVR